MLAIAMRNHRLYQCAHVILKLLLLLLCSPTFAVAEFQWLDANWQVGYPVQFMQGDGGQYRTSGDTAADTILLKSYSRADNDNEVNSIYTAPVTASRRFRLSNSPAGWSVTLKTTLTGTMGIGGSLFYDPEMYAFVDASAEIRIKDQAPSLSTSLTKEFDEEDQSKLFLGEATSDTQILQDGDYVVSGELFTQAEAQVHIFAEIDAISNFYIDIPPLLSPPSGKTSGLTISVSASSLPIPGLEISSLSPQDGSTLTLTSDKKVTLSAKVEADLPAGTKLRLDLFLGNVKVGSKEFFAAPFSFDAPAVVLASGAHTVKTKAEVINTITNKTVTEASQTATFNVVTTKPCSGPECFIYVGHRDQGVVDVIDAATNQIVNTIPVSLLGNLKLAMTPDGSRIYAIGDTGGPADVSVIDTIANAEIDTVPVPGDATYTRAVAVSSNGEQVYVAGFLFVPDAAFVFTVIDTSIGTVRTEVLKAGLEECCVDALTLSADGKRAYLTLNHATGTDALLVLDIATLVGTPIPIGKGPHHLAISPDGGRIYVVNRDSDNVSVIDTATNQVIDTIAVGDRPEGIAITPDGSRAYVAVFVDAFSGRLEVIDTTTNTVTGSIFLNGRNGPKEIAITPDGTRAYVTFEADRVVSVIALATNRIVQTIEIGTPTVGIAIGALPLFGPSIGDIYPDGIIDQVDLNMLLEERNKIIKNSTCGLACDLDGDGMITVLDARRLVNLCTRPLCASH